MNKPDSGARPGRPITRNRAHVLETAMNAYWQDDRAAVSVNAVCALAGVSKPSLYRDFGSEDGLTDAVLERYGQTVLASVEALLSGPQAYGAKLDALITFASDDPRMEAGCLFVKMRAARSRFGAQTRARLAATEAHVQAHFERFFTDAAARGEWRGGIAPDLAASYLHEQVALALSRRAAGKSPEAVRAMLALAISVLR
ncbi:MAG: TetR/AcrR family transcriptional regulator [Pseudomonadales bacterium]